MPSKPYEGPADGVGKLLPRHWRVERVTDRARELIASGIIQRQDCDDIAIAIATAVGRVVKRNLPDSLACRWIDITTATGRRFETRYTSTADDWFEMREEIAAALDESRDTALIHRTENLHITIYRTLEKS